MSNFLLKTFTKKLLKNTNSMQNNESQRFFFSSERRLTVQISLILLFLKFDNGPQKPL